MNRRSALCCDCAVVMVVCSFLVSCEQSNESNDVQDATDDMSDASHGESADDEESDNEQSQHELEDNEIYWSYAGGYTRPWIFCEL